MLEELLELNVASMERRYKSREKIEPRVEPPYAIRLDGVSFSKSLEGFTAPRDRRVHSALVGAASELVRRFSAVGALVASDEVNLIVMGRGNPYAGRVEKLVSITASIMGATVSLALGRPLAFDARVIPLENAADAAEYVAFRARVALNNLVNSLLYEKGIEPGKGVRLAERIEMLRSAGVNFDALPEWMKTGSSVLWLTLEIASGKKKRAISVEEGYHRLYLFLRRHAGEDSQ